MSEKTYVLTESQIKQIRADVIDEVLSLTKLNHYDEYNDLMYQSINVNAIRRLKDKN